MFDSVPQLFLLTSFYTPSKSERGSAYSSMDITAYREQTHNELKRYSTLSADEKNSAVASEFVGVRGSISVPVASSYSDSKTSITEIAAEEGVLAEVAKRDEIDICGFLGDLFPDATNQVTDPFPGIPQLEDLVKEINGIATPVLEFGADAIMGVIGGATRAIGDVASAIQDSIPNITCSKALPLPTPVQLGLASAIFPGAPIVAAVAPVVIEQIGIKPPINVSSPDVTVQSLNDVLEAGEF